MGTAAIVAIALPATAGAEYLVPPSNSAATQYTETLPTAGGHGDTEKASKGRKRSPAEVLGARDAKKLDQQGQSGQEVAEFTAETAPSEETTPPAPAAGGAGSTVQDKSPSKRDEDAGAGAGGGKGGPPGPNRAAARPEAPGPEGSSGLTEVIAQATGSSSSGQLGLLLPLALIAALAWALAFLWRQHNRSTV